MTRLMPSRLNLGSYMQSTMAHPLHMRQEAAENPAFYNPQNLRTVMGFVIPTWQRPLVWTEAQKVKFVESAWLGINLGTYTYQQQDFTDEKDANGKSIPSPYNGFLIDGQQRMSALQDYFDDKFAVFGYKWSELDVSDHRGFSMTAGFGCYIARFQTEQEMIEMYERLSFGGTPHTEADRPVKQGEVEFKPGVR